MKKAKKVFRYLKARLQPASALPFFWHVGTPNFGDDINPALFNAALSKPVRLQTRRDRPHFWAWEAYWIAQIPPLQCWGRVFLPLL